MKLSLNSLNQHGGAIVDFNDKLIKVTSTADDINYSSINAFSNNFNTEQMKSIHSFINFVLPYISYNGKVLGLDAIKNIETVYGGSFGMTLTLEDFIIKISRANSPDDINNHVKEISNLEYLFDKSVPTPDSLNQYLGFISSKKYADLEKYNKYAGNLNIYTNIFDSSIFTINESDLMRVNTNLTNDDYLKNKFLDNMVIIFFKKEDMSLSDFIRQNTGLTVKEKLLYANDILNDLREALTFLHQTKRVMHCDIKPDNIVATKDPVSGRYKFKLIDYGSISKIYVTGVYDLTNLVEPGMTEYFITGTKHFTKLSYLYDYHCVLFSIFILLGIKDMNNFLKIYENINNLQKGNIKGKLAIKLFIEFINKNNPLNLPSIDNLDNVTERNIIKFYKNIIVLMLVASLEKYTPIMFFYK